MEAHWSFASACPPEWDQLLARCSGGFFHSPAALRLQAPDVEPVFARYLTGSEVLGITAGSRARCGLSMGPRHVYVPALPALVPAADAHAAIGRLVRAIRKLGAAELVIGGPTPAWQRPATAASPNGEEWLEFITHLDRPFGSLVADLAEPHRRAIHEGDERHWSVREPARFDGRAPWGTTTFEVRGTESRATALVGWANRRAVLLAGSQTTGADRLDPAVWLQWRIMLSLRQQGFECYSLVAPAEARDPSHAEHGQYRFNARFGGEVVHRKGRHWVFSPTHLRAHRIEPRTAVVQ